MLLLSLETSSSVCSVALHRVADGSLVGQSELRLDKSHSTHLTILIEQLLKNTGYQLADLAAVAVSDGPGSYTGLRIGAAAAKGLCFALDGQEVLAPTPLILDADTLAEQLAQHSVLFFGNGAVKFQAVLAESAQAGFLAGIEPSAVAVGALAIAAYHRQEFQDVAYYEPFYLKEVYTTTPRS